MMLITTIVKNLMFLLEQNFVNVLHLQSLLIVKGLFKSVDLKKKHLSIFVLLKLLLLWSNILSTEYLYAN